MVDYNENNGSRADESVNTIGAEEHGHGTWNEKRYQSIAVAYLRRRWHKGIAKESWSETGQLGMNIFSVMRADFTCYK